jgi:NAD(P)H-hydrate epimerase
MSNRVLTAEQMQKVDADTIAGGVPGIELMERAGRGVTHIIQARFAQGHAAVFVGPGNNGGDGLVVARCSSRRDGRASIHPAKARHRVHTGHRRKLRSGAPHAAHGRATATTADERCRGATVLIDSIFGTGFPARHVAAAR